MKRLFLSLFIFVALMLQSNVAEAYYGRPYFYNGYYSGVPVGYGYFGFGYWPTLVFNNPFNLGYSFYPYYNYQPYYATYGAISFSVKTGKFGYAWGQSYLSGAVNSSNAYCGGDDCRAVVWVQGGCAAVSVNSASQSLGWGYGANRMIARQNAVQACRNSGGVGSQCAPAAYVCSF